MTRKRCATGHENGTRIISGFGGLLGGEMVVGELNLGRNEGSVGGKENTKQWVGRSRFESSHCSHMNLRASLGNSEKGLVPKSNK